MQLEQEIATYWQKLPELMQHKGKYVLIHGDRVIDTLPSYEEAIRQGYQHFGLEPGEELQKDWPHTELAESTEFLRAGSSDFYPRNGPEK